MATLSTTAWILHDLGMAAGFGGNLFGKAALDPAVKRLDSKQQRGQVLDSAWGRFEPVDALALGAMATTWLVGRSAFSGRRLGRSIRRLVLAKDVLVGAALVTGVASLFYGRVLRAQHRQGAVPGGTGEAPTDVPSSKAQDREQMARKALAVLGPLNTALIAGAIAVNAALAQASGKSTRWSAIARLLP